MPAGIFASPTSTVKSYKGWLRDIPRPRAAVFRSKEKSCAKLIPEQSDVAGVVVAGEYVSHAPRRSLTVAMPGALSSLKGKFARWQTSVISATAGKARRQREDCCSTARRGCKGGDSGPILGTGDRDQSLLIKAVHYMEETRMPPDGKKLAGPGGRPRSLGEAGPLPGRRERKTSGGSCSALGLSTGEATVNSNGPTLGTITG